MTDRDGQNGDQRGPAIKPWVEAAPSAPRDTDVADQEPYTAPGFDPIQEDDEDGAFRHDDPVAGKSVDPAPADVAPPQNPLSHDPADAIVTQDDSRPPPYFDRRSRPTADDPTPAFRTAPGAPYPGPFAPDATEHGPSPGATRGMSPIPGMSPPASSPEQLTTGAERFGGRVPVMPPDQSRLYDNCVAPAFAEAAARSTPHGLAPTQATSLPQHRARVIVLAVVVFIVCFVGTGGVFWWLSSRYETHERRPQQAMRSNAETENPTKRIVIPRLPPPPPELALTANPPATPAHPPATPTPSMPESTHPDPTKIRQQVERLLHEGDEEMRRIAPHLGVSNQAELQQAVAVPRGHYDAAQERYRQAHRHDGGLRQCTVARMAAAAERLATVLEMTATAPQIITIEDERFPREVRDAAETYRNVARRYFREASALQPPHEDCARLAREGSARLSTSTPP